MTKTAEEPTTETTDVGEQAKLTTSKRDKPANEPRTSFACRFRSVTKEGGARWDKFKDAFHTIIAKSVPAGKTSVAQDS